MEIATTALALKCIKTLSERLIPRLTCENDRNTSSRLLTLIMLIPKMSLSRKLTRHSDSRLHSPQNKGKHPFASNTPPELLFLSFALTQRCRFPQLPVGLTSVRLRTTGHLPWRRLMRFSLEWIDCRLLELQSIQKKGKSMSEGPERWIRASRAQLMLPKACQILHGHTAGT